ncbi:DNA polymerase zeta catalytic subunit [Perkinsus olseni]|uniref:DNA polymerase n=1 Tax=Perkinsus olseni TaxID=32597 RepID=A0A7J6NUK6_PEROL|nr:DNA polymerase zeta catalytic subunit [Perkinsus olseni]
MASSRSFVMRLYKLDWYLAEPYPALGDLDISIITAKRLSVCPVIRLYGHVVSADPDARVQCCLHVHGYYPKILFSAEAFQSSVTERQFAEGLEYIMNGGGGQWGQQQQSPCVADVKKTSVSTYMGIMRLRRKSSKCDMLTQASGSNGRIFELHIPYTLQLVSECGLAAGTTVHIKADALSTRGSLAEGVPFPYIPESRATGRPTPQSMPCHAENAARLDALREAISKQEADSGSQGAYQTQKAALEELFEVVPDEAVPGPDAGPLAPPPPDVGPQANEYAESNLSESSAGSDVGLGVACTLLESKAGRDETTEAVLAPRMNDLYEFTPSPPSREALLKELSGQEALSPRYLTAPKQHDRTSASIDYCTLLYLEVVIQLPRGMDKWDPTLHPIVAVVCILRDQRQVPLQRTWIGVIGDLLKEDHVLTIDPLATLLHVSCETELILALDHLFAQFDPTVVISWDASRKGIVFIAERARVLGLPDNMFHRVAVAPVPGPMGPSTLYGRITLDLWQTLRQEDSLKLATTTLHGAAKQLLGLTLPRIPMWLLQEWWTDGSRCTEALKYTVRLCTLGLQAPGCKCLAKSGFRDGLCPGHAGCGGGKDTTTGVLTRGSQYRVECILHRAATRSGFSLVTSSKAQVKGQPALEGVPMVLEPRSGYYRTPTIILDFQSLYPSIIIAYNMCYSTCLGRVEHQDLLVSLGTQQDKPYTIKRSSSLLQEDNVAVASNGAVFVQPSCRVGILPRMLHEVLQTRIMVKRAMKNVKPDDSPALHRIMDARQLGLKLLANVTYGYAGASYSGRMPCSELADAIVMTARRTLQHAMSVAEDMGATVFYGDTDSMFIRPPSDHCGSVEAAFEFGRRLADCVTMSKKRYCGWAYEHPKASPVFFAKGIETVRRDSCPFTANAVRTVLEAMFRTDPRADEALHIEAGRRAGRDVIRRVLNGEISKVDFIFQNQVRLSYRGKNLPPAAHVAVIQGLDTGYKERVAYVVARKAGDRSNAKLLDRVMPPYRVAGPRGLVLDTNYYLTKQFFPAVQRILAPIVPNVADWLSENLQVPGGAGSLECFSCHTPLDHRQGHRWVCDSCLARSPAVVVRGGAVRARLCEAKSRASRRLCEYCTEGSLVMAAGCGDAYHCENYFLRSDAPIAELRARRYLAELDDRLPGDWGPQYHSQSDSKRASSAKTEVQMSQETLSDVLAELGALEDSDGAEVYSQEVGSCDIPIEQSPPEGEPEDLSGVDLYSDFSIEEDSSLGDAQGHSVDHDDDLSLTSWSSHVADSTLDVLEEPAETREEAIDSISLSDDQGTPRPVSESSSLEIIDCD